MTTGGFERNVDIEVDLITKYIATPYHTGSDEDNYKACLESLQSKELEDINKIMEQIQKNITPTHPNEETKLRSAIEFLTALRDQKALEEGLYQKVGSFHDMLQSMASSVSSSRSVTSNTAQVQQRAPPRPVTFGFNQATTRKTSEQKLASPVARLNQGILDLVETRERSINNEGVFSRKGHDERAFAIKQIKTAITQKMTTKPDELINFDLLLKEIESKLLTSNLDNPQDNVDKLNKFKAGTSEKSTKLTGGDSEFAKMQVKIAKIEETLQSKAKLRR